ncbi:MAG: TlpA family protein disulfide reductase [Rhodoferax sp.]|nr:TlpA family protein disulfide reductase [Rhodoferax sp.]
MPAEPISPTDSQDSVPQAVPVWQRRWVVGALGAAAASAGLGLAWWNFSDQAADSEPVPGFWGLQWDTPGGAILQAASFRGRPLLINFWATWCPPCIEELPLINRFFHEHRANGWQVLALAVDRLAPVQSFLSKNPLDFPVGMAGLNGTDLGRALGNLTGGLPFSVVVGQQGGVLKRKLGRLTEADLGVWSRLK